MGYKLNTLMREDQIAGSIKSAEEQYHRQTLEAAIDKESSARESVDAEIKADVEQLFNNLSDEIVLRAQDDLNVKNELQAAIDSETAIRSAQDLALLRTIDAEGSARFAADNQLKADYISADSALLDQINNDYNPKIAALNTALHDEQILSANRHATLASDLTASINAEKSARSTADSDLQNSLASEISTREFQTDALGAAVTKEIADRTADVNNLQSNLSNAIGNEATTRASADSVLQNSIATAQSNLNTAINKEATTRAAAVTSLQNSITSAVNNIQSTIKDFTPSTTTKDGTAGFVPAPPKKKSEDEILVLTSDGFQTLAESNIFIGAIPSQNGEPQYTGSAISPQWLNYEDQKMSISGTTSATNAGTYTATFTPIGLYCWTDGTRTAKNVQWRILPKVITVPTASTTEFTYSGSAITLTVNNPNSDGTSQTGTVSATNAGNYTATYKLKSTTNYIFSDGTTTDKSIAWKIKPKSVTIPTAAVTQFEYTGDTITLSVTNPNADCINVSGATWAVNAGSYTATYKLKSTSNYVFSDGTTADKSINWKINAKKLAKPTASTTSFTYNKSSQGLTISNYDSNYMTKSGTDTAVAAASYSVTFALKNTTNTTWSDGTTSNVVISWSIAVLKLTKPSASTTAFTYDGTSKNLSVSNFNSNYESLSGSTSEINAGSYSATYSLLDTTNTTWSDGSTADITLSWQITRKKLTAAQSTFSQSGTLTYNGSAQSPTISGYNASYHDLSSTTSATNAGTYTAQVTPKSNFAWSDGTFAAKSASWSIGIYKLDKPTAAATEFEYTGATFTLNISNYNANYMNRTGTYSASAEGDYSVTFTLKDTSNFNWKDNTSSAVVINWKIKTNKLAKPTITAGASLEYTGGTLKPTIADYNSERMTQSGTASAVNVGSYSITYALKDKTNTTWSDGSTADITLSWQITRKKLTAAQSTFSQSGTLTYNGSAQSPTISGYNASYHDLSSTTSATNAGTYTAKVTPKSNYAFSDGSTAAKSVSWSIGAKSLSKPTAATTSFEYDGAVKTLSISNYNSSYMTKSGTDSASVKGNYEVTFTLNDTSNLKWADNTTSEVKIPWSIGSKSIAKPTISGDTTFTYDGNAKTLNVTGYDSDTMILSGTISATNAGDYTATFTLRDKTNTCWASGDTNDVQFSWKINRAVFTTAQQTFGTYVVDEPGSNNQIYTDYTGELQFLPGFDERYHKNYYQNAGNIKWAHFGTDAGEYSVSLVPNDNYSWNYYSNYSHEYIISTAVVLVNWTIRPLAITKPSLSGNTSFTYDGNTKSINVSGYDSGTMSFSGKTSATNVGTYNATYNTKNSNYVWSDTNARGEVTFDWEITAKKITKPTIQAGVNYWTGNNITIGINNFDSTYMEKSGTDTAVDVGQYTLTFALKDKTNTTWADGSTDDVVLTWYLNRRPLTAPSITNTSFTYDGKSHAPTIKDFNSTYMTKTGTESATEAGNFTITFALKDKKNCYWWDNSTDDISFTWTINKVVLTKPSLTNTTYTYDGTAHSPTINDYNSTYESQTGTASSTNAGNFTLTYALKDKTNNITWADGSTDDIVLSWVINKATPTLTLSTDTLTFDATGTQTVTATYTGDGSLSASSNDSDIVASISNKVITVKANFISKATVTVNAAQTTNYNAVSKTFSVSFIYEVSFADCTWAQIQKVAKKSVAYEVFSSSIGACKTVDCSVDFSNVGIYNTITSQYKSYSSLRIRLIDTPQDKAYIACRIEPPTSTAYAIVFADDKPTNNTSSDGFCYANFSNFAGALYSGLPDDLKSVMSNGPGAISIILAGTEWAGSGIFYNYFWVHGLADMLSQSEIDALDNSSNLINLTTSQVPSTAQMEFFANGNGKAVYRQYRNGSTGSGGVRFALRDYSINSPYRLRASIDANGKASGIEENSLQYPCDFAPCFFIG